MAPTPPPPSWFKLLMFALTPPFMQPAVFLLKCVSAVVYYLKKLSPRVRSCRRTPVIEQLSQPDSAGHATLPSLPTRLMSAFSDEFDNCPWYLWHLGIVAGVVNAGGALLDWLMCTITFSDVSLVNFLQPDFRLSGLDSKVTFADHLGDVDKPQVEQITPKDVLLALVSKLMYESHIFTRKTLQEWGFSHFADLSYNSANVQLPGLYFFNTRAVVLRLGPSAVVAFRGTQPTSLVQWLTDGALDMVPCPATKGIQAHRGFMAALGMLELDPTLCCDNTPLPSVPMFVQIVRVLRDEDFCKGVTDIYVTGHSLGAALANVFAYSVRSLASDDNNFIECPLAKAQVREVASLLKGVYTYGTPRQGGADYAADYGRLLEGIATHRVINNADVVCRVPLTPGDPFFSLFEARGVDLPTYIPTKGARYVITYPNGHSVLQFSENGEPARQDVEAEARGKLAEHVRRGVSLYPIMDHIPDFYVRGLDNIRQRDQTRS